MKKAWQQARERMRAAAAVGWDLSPISTPRLSAELYNAVKDLDWSLVNAGNGTSGWPNRFFATSRHYHWLGGSRGARPGYGTPAASGAAPAHKTLGRCSVSIHNDGARNDAPGC